MVSFSYALDKKTHTPILFLIPYNKKKQALIAYF
jgi:hypothetical protein